MISTETSSYPVTMTDRTTLLIVKAIVIIPALIIRFVIPRLKMRQGPAPGSPKTKWDKFLEYFMSGF